MDHVAIDLGARKSQICVRSADGEIVEEKRLETWDLKQYLASRPKSRVIVETCAEAFGVAEAARELGHETRIVPATLVRTLGVGARRTKTDQRDARALSEVSCRVDLPSVHIPKAQSRERKTFCGMRDSLVSARTKVINTVRGWLRGQGRRLGKGSSPTFAKRVRALCGADLPDYVERQLRVVEALTDGDRRGRQGFGEPSGAGRDLSAPDDGSGRRTRDCASVRRRHRRYRSLRDGAPGRVVLGTGAGRELELRSAATSLDHEGRTGGTALGTGPSSMGAENALSAAGGRPPAALGAPGRTSERKTNSDGRAGPQAGGDPLRDLARRNGVRRQPWRQDDLRFDRRAAQKRSAGSDRQLSEDGDRDLIPGVCTTSFRRLRPVDGFSLCATSANTRMRQPVDLLPTFSPTSTDPTCSKSDRTDPFLWGQPLHTGIKRTRPRWWSCPSIGGRAM